MEASPLTFSMRRTRGRPADAALVPEHWPSPPPMSTRSRHIDSATARTATFDLTEFPAPQSPSVWTAAIRLWLQMPHGHRKAAVGGFPSGPHGLRSAAEMRTGG
jgi:hypothetical protein